MVDAYDEQAREVERAEDEVADAHGDFLVALRDGAKTEVVDRLYDAEQAAIRRLAKVKERFKAKELGVLEVMDAQARQADAEAVVRARKQVEKVSKRFGRHVDKLERGMEIMDEAFTALARVSDEVGQAMHPSDKDAKTTKWMREFRAKLTYSVQVQLSANGIPTLQDTAAARKQAKSTSPRSVVDSFIGATSRHA